MPSWRQICRVGRNNQEHCQVAARFDDFAAPRVNRVMNVTQGNIFADVPKGAPEEVFETLLANDFFKLERIVSNGQESPSGEWYDQEHEEWVLLLEGAAGLVFDGELPAIELHRGDYVRIPAHCRHRVQWTSQEEPTIWLTLHFQEGGVHAAHPERR